MAISNILSNILNGISDAATARGILKTIAHGPENTLDISVGYDGDYGQLYTRADLEDEAKIKVAATGSDGVFCQTKTADGDWITVPATVRRGGTGATTAADARTNLGLAATRFNVTATNGVTISGQASFKLGDLVCLSFRFTKASALSAEQVAQIPAGYRPVVTSSGTAIASATGDTLPFAVGSAGNCVIGNGFVTGIEYRVNLIYCTV